MPRGKRKKEAPAPAVQQMNAAPGYAAPAAPASGYGGAPAAYGAQPPTNGNAGYGAPPPQAPRNPFVNAQFLYQFGKPIKATIQAMRPATGGRAEYANRGGWFLDLTLENGTAATGRINVGDQRHQRLWAAYGEHPIGKTVVLRLTHPGDQTKAPWTIDAL